MSEEAITELSFEAALAQLEETVQRLEAGDLALAEALALFGQGQALAKQCQMRLDTAVLQVEQLKD